MLSQVDRPGSWCHRSEARRCGRSRRPKPKDQCHRTATISALIAILEVNPVPWARAQMAFTLGFHIILVPLGVSWAFMTLIANYRGLRHNDRDAGHWPNGGRSTWP